MGYHEVRERLLRYYAAFPVVISPEQVTYITPFSRRNFRVST